MKRSEARENAFLMLFEASFSSSPDAEAIINLAAENMGYEIDDYCRSLFFGVLEKKSEVDQKINEFSTKWKTDRLSKVALVASEIAVYEISENDVPSAVAVNESIELIKKYDTEESAKYINGVLGGYVRSNEK